MLVELSARECHAKLSQEPRPILLDVREDWELKLVSLPQSVHIPMAAVPERLSELSPEQDIIVMCHAGVRSRKVAEYLDAHEFKMVINMSDGIAGWQREVDPTLPSY
jgi:rhodanese-related sulfurtransferase